MTKYVFASLARLYFNRSGDTDKLWSIDFGAGTEELQFSIVELDDVYGSITRYDQTAIGSKTLPAGWLEFKGVEIWTENTRAKITNSFNWALLHKLRTIE